MSPTNLHYLQNVRNQPPLVFLEINVYDSIKEDIASACVAGRPQLRPSAPAADERLGVAAVVSQLLEDIF